jgi:hypothetical protein
MNATLTTFYLIQKIKQDFFLYYISCKENKCWKIFKIMRKLLFNYYFYSHPEIEKFQAVTLRYLTNDNPHLAHSNLRYLDNYNPTLSIQGF